MNVCDDALAAWTAHLAGDGEPLPEVAREHLESCPRCTAEKEDLARLLAGIDRLAEEAPSDELRDRFAAALLAYREAMEAAPAAVATPAEGRRWPLRFPSPSRRRATARVARLGWGVAAMLAGVALGVLVRPQTPQGEVLELRREVSGLREVLALSLLQQASASARLEGVSLGAAVARENPAVLAALLDTLAADPSPNVRLATVEALASRAAEPTVQKKLGEALRKEPSPLVQIALADALLDARDARARRLVEPLAVSSDVLPEVRQHVSDRLAKSL